MDTMNIHQGNQNKGMSQHYGSYGSTLIDPRWKAKRKEILDRDHNKCVNCGSDKELEIHHRQYHFSKTLEVFKSPWEYEDKYLITLCEVCHQSGHRIYKVPVKFVK